MQLVDLNAFISSLLRAQSEGAVNAFDASNRVVSLIKYLAKTNDVKGARHVAQIWLQECVDANAANEIVRIVDEALASEGDADERRDWYLDSQSLISDVSVHFVV